MAPVFQLDDHLAPHLVDDEVFAQAYAALGPEQRARLKTCAAHALASRPGRGLVREERSLAPDGLAVARREVARPWALLVMGPDVASPVRPLAAACIARLHGVDQVSAAFLGSGPREVPQAVLTALELAGVEQAAHLDDVAASSLAKALGQGAQPGALLALGDEARAWSRDLDAMPPNGPVLWRERRAKRLGVWTQDAAWDWDALAFAHPDAEFLLGGVEGDAPQGLEREASLQSLLDRGLDALYAPQEVLEQATGAAPLLLGPGCETCWFHPDLGPSVLTRASETWTLHTPTLT